MTGVPIQTKGMPNISELLQIVVEPIIFKEKSVIENVDPTSLQLIPKSTEFKFEQGLESAVIILKQTKAHIRIEGQMLAETNNSNKAVDVSIEVL